MDSINTGHTPHPLLQLINLILWTCAQSTALVIGATQISDLVSIVELLKMMVTISLSIISTLFMYVINREKINAWWKQQGEVKWWRKLGRKKK